MPLTQAAPDSLAKVYARSLFELAMERGGQAMVEQVLGELEDVIELARENTVFDEFLSSRIVANKNRSASLTRIFQGKLSDLTLRFLLVLNEKGRVGHLVPIVGALDLLVQEEFGRIEVDVFTAAPMSSDELGAIRERLKSTLGREPIVHPYIDPSMIGGLRLKIGDQLIDASVASSLRKMRERLAGDGSTKIRAIADRLISD